MTRVFTGSLLASAAVSLWLSLCVGTAIAANLAGSVVGGVLYSLIFQRPDGGMLNPVHFLVSIAGAVAVLAVVKAVSPPALSDGGSSRQIYP